MASVMVSIAVKAILITVSAAPNFEALTASAFDLYKFYRHGRWYGRKWPYRIYAVWYGTDLWAQSWPK